MRDYDAEGYPVPELTFSRMEYFNDVMREEVKSILNDCDYVTVRKMLDEIHYENLKSDIVKIVCDQINHFIKTKNDVELFKIISECSVYINDTTIDNLDEYIKDKWPIASLVESSFRIKDLNIIDYIKKEELLHSLPDKRIYSLTNVLIIKSKDQYYLMKCLRAIEGGYDKPPQEKYLYFKKSDISYDGLNDFCNSLVHTSVIFDIG